ncbi:MAG: enoyl-ACP reductase [Candidatus Obscuribacterales bacterium]|nr:enoyl-ACP reductase [Candidatus Obscuribacterales bacterium]
MDKTETGHGLMKGKRGIIFGVASDRSLAWHCASVLHAEGAELAFTYQGEMLERRVKPLVEKVNSPFVEQCDLGDDKRIDEVFAKLSKIWDSLDFVIHAVAFANREDLEGHYSDTSRAGFALALDVSAYTLTAVTKRALPMMKSGGSVVTLTYYGAEKVVPHYNVMGVAKAALEASVMYLAADLGERNVRVNAISAGPVKTLAAMGISGFREMLKIHEQRAPMRRNVEAEEVGKSVLFLVSDLASGVTGEVIHVDCGYSILGM